MGIIMNPNLRVSRKKNPDSDFEFSDFRCMNFINQFDIFHCFDSSPKLFFLCMQRTIGVGSVNRLHELH